MTIDMGAEGYVARGGFRINAHSANGDKELFAGGTGEILSAHATALQGIMLNHDEGLYGLSNEAQAGAYVAKGDLYFGGTILGVTYKATLGGSLISAHCGIGGSVVYCPETGMLTIKGFEHLGLIIGEKVEGELSVPLEAIEKIGTFWTH
jgi:hypothetical protein